MRRPFLMAAILLTAIFACGVGAQQILPPLQENANLLKQVRDLQRKVDAMDARLKIVEDNQRYRMTPVTTQP